MLLGPSGCYQEDPSGDGSDGYPCGEALEQVTEHLLRLPTLGSESEALS